VAVTCEWWITDESFFLVQYGYTRLVQRLFNCGKIQDINCTSEKVLNSLIYGSRFCVVIYTSYKLSNMVWFLWSTRLLCDINSPNLYSLFNFCWCIRRNKIACWSRLNGLDRPLIVQLCKFDFIGMIMNDDVYSVVNCCISSKTDVTFIVVRLETEEYKSYNSYIRRVADCIYYAANMTKRIRQINCFFSVNKDY